MTSTVLLRVLRAIYTGALRTRFKLMVPGYLRDWLLDQGRGGDDD